MGLVLAMLAWEFNFDKRYDADGKVVSHGDTYMQTLVLATTLLAVISLVIKEYCASEWMVYRNPFEFSSQIMNELEYQAGNIDFEQMH